MDNAILSLLTLILGGIQICDILVSIGLYYVYDKRKEYLSAIFLWIGMFLMFIGSYLLGEVSVKHIFLSYVFAGFTSIAMAWLVGSLYEIEFNWKIASIRFLLAYLTAFVLYLMGIESFAFLGFILSLGICLPVIIMAIKGFKKVKWTSTNIEVVFLLTVFIWGVHFLDYPYLRPIKDTTYSVFGFSFGLFLTYITSILIPVVINRKIFLEFNALLSERLDLKEQQLNFAQKEIISKEKLAMVGTLTAGVAHEIKNPLNIIKNTNYMLKEYLDHDLMKYSEEGLSHEQIAEMVKKDKVRLNNLYIFTEKNVDRADVIIKNMLMHSRQSDSDLRMEDINNIVLESLNFYLNSTKRDTKAKLIKNLDLNAKTNLYVSIQDLSRALINLFENACYAMNEKLDVADYQPELLVKTWEDDENIFINIRDNGIGIPKNIKDKITDPFYTTKPPGEGTGLGLYLVHEIITKHSGSIKIDSVAGEFTDVLISLSKKNQNR